MVENKVIIFDELSDENERDGSAYAKRLLEKNKLIILSNPYGGSDDGEKEIILFKNHEKEILTEDALLVFVKPE